MTTTTLSLPNIKPQPGFTFSSVVGFYFALRLIAVVIAARLFQVDPQMGVIASLSVNYIVLLVAAFLSFGPRSRSYSWFFSIASHKWSLAFLLLSGFSLLWTSSISISAAAAFWCAMACDFVTAILLLRSGDIDSTTLALMSGFVCGACIIAVAAWILPSQTDLRLGDEDYLGPNQIGYTCAFAIFLAQYLIRRNIKGFVLPVLFLSITLLRSLSKTTIIAFLAGQTFLLFRDRSLRAKTKLLLGAAGVVVVAAFWGLLSAYYDVYTNAGNQSETLTGRLGIWAYILSDAVQQPWFGHGFHSVWKVIPPFGPFEARHAHNELLQQFYAYGLAGIVVLIGLYWSVYREMRRISDASVRTLFLAMLIFILVRGLADTEVFDLSLPLWVIALIGPTAINHRITSMVSA